MKNWTEPRALRATNQRLRKMSTIAGEVAYLWGDVDNYAVCLCDELLKHIEDVRLEIVASVQARADDRESTT